MILAIDQGTTGSTAIVFDAEGRPAGRSYSEFTQHFPRPTAPFPGEECGPNEHRTFPLGRSAVRTLWASTAPSL